MRLVLEQELMIPEAARRLALSDKTLANWVPRARREITEYIELLYNRQRRHSRLGNFSPAAFAQHLAR